MTSDETLDELEGPAWADPDDPSPIVQRIRALGRMPLREFTPEDYRVVITQQRALGTLVPLALELLEAEPFAEGDLYCGDLLVAVARLTPGFWSEHKQLAVRLRRILAAALSRLGEVDDDDRLDLEPQLRAAYEAF
jgi:hypothetical protein